MKKFLVLIMAFAAITSTAFATDLISINTIGLALRNQLRTAANAHDVLLSNTTADGTFVPKIAKASFSFADGDLAVTTVHGLGVSLPAKALIIRSWIHITTQFADTGTCTFAIQCEDANNIKTTTDISGSAADAIIEGESTGAASAFKKSIGAACEISSLMTDSSSCVPSAGAGEAYVMYVVLP